MGKEKKEKMSLLGCMDKACETKVRLLLEKLGYAKI